MATDPTDTDPTEDAPLRPRARPDGAFEPDQLRPHGRPEGLARLSDETQHAATHAEALPLNRTALIGLFSGPDGSTALVRLPSGEITRVTQGGDLDGGRVTAISEDGLRLQKGEVEFILTMPS